MNIYYSTFEFPHKDVMKKLKRYLFEKYILLEKLDWKNSPPPENG